MRNNIFQNVPDNGTYIVGGTLATNNSGQPDGDLAYLDGKNWIGNFVTNYNHIIGGLAGFIDLSALAFALGIAESEIENFTEDGRDIKCFVKTEYFMRNRCLGLISIQYNKFY